MTDATQPNPTSLALWGTYNPDSDKKHVDERAEESDFIAMKEPGEYVFRIIPPLLAWSGYFERTGRELSPFFFFWKHFFQDGKNNISYPCPEKMGDYGFAPYPDPACKRAEFLRGTGSPDDFEVGGDMQARLRVLVNVIDRDNERKGPRIWEFGAPMGRRKGKSVWEKLEAKMTGQRARRELVNPITGFDIVITKSGSGRLDTNYELDVLPEPSTLCEDQEKMRAWIEMQKDLRNYVRPPTPEMLAQILAGTHYYTAGKLIPKQGKPGGQAPPTQTQAARPPQADLGTVIDAFASPKGDDESLEF